MATLEITTPEGANRLRCKNNHSAITPTNNHWLCTSCARHWEVDPEYETVRDAKTGREYRREEVRFDPEVPGVRI